MKVHSCVRDFIRRHDSEFDVKTVYTHENKTKRGQEQGKRRKKTQQ